MAVLIDSGEFPSAKGKSRGALDTVIGKWQMKIGSGFNEGAEWLLKAIKEIDELELWKTYWGGQFDFNANREAFIKRKLLVDFSIIDETIPEILAKLHRGEPFTLPRTDGTTALFPAVSAKPAEEAQQERRALEKEGYTADLPNIPPQKQRAKTNGISERTQRNLDRIARESPSLLAEVRAGRKSIHRAAVELGIVKVPTPLEKVLHAFNRLSVEDQAAFWQAVTQQE